MLPMMAPLPPPQHHREDRMVDVFAIAIAIAVVVAVVIAIGSGLVLGPGHDRKDRRSVGRERESKRESDTVRASGPARPRDATRARLPAVARPSRRGGIPG